jgi:hypothetical protein
VLAGAAAALLVAAAVLHLRARRSSPRRGAQSQRLRR